MGKLVVSFSDFVIGSPSGNMAQDDDKSNALPTPRLGTLFLPHHFWWQELAFKPRSGLAVA